MLIFVFVFYDKVSLSKSNKSNISTNLDLHAKILVTANSNTARESFLYAIDPQSQKIQSISVDSQGLYDIVEDYDKKNAWIAPYGIFQQTQNNYVLCLSLDTQQQTKVSIDGLGPAKIISNQNGVFVISQGNGLSGVLTQIDPTTKRSVRSLELKGFLNSIVSKPDGDIYVAADIMDPKNPLVKTAYYQINGKDLQITNSIISEGPTLPNSLIYFDNHLFVASGSDENQIDYGSTVTDLDSTTLNKLSQYKVGQVPNRLLLFPDQKSILVLNYYPRTELTPPCANIIIPSTRNIKGWEGVPESAAATFVDNYLWCVTFDGQLKKIPIGESVSTWNTTLEFKGSNSSDFFSPSAMAYMY